MSKIFVFVFVVSVSGTLMFNFALTAYAEHRETGLELKVGEETAHEIQERLRAYVLRNQIANLSFGVWQNGHPVAEGNYGPVSQANSNLVSDTTIYRIRSMTKPVTAIGLLILMERGHFRLSDPITRFLPEFETTETLADIDEQGMLYTYPSLSPPTMGQLLSHTAGFAYWQPSGGIIDQHLLAAEIGLSEDTDALVSTLATYPYIALPGSEWNYSLASDLQGAIIERLTGLSLAAFLKKEIFDPLGMFDTGFYVPETKTARLSDVTNGSGTAFEYVASDPSDRAAQSRVYFEGGHGLYSTRRDYIKFLNAIRGDGRQGEIQLLSTATLERVRTNAIKYRGAPGPRRPYGRAAGLGFGFGVGVIEDPRTANLSAPNGTYYWHGALGTFFWVDPVNELVFVGMLQSETKVEPDLMAAAMDAIYGQIYLDPPDSPESQTAHASEGSG